MELLEELLSRWNKTMTRSYFETPFEARWLLCRSPKNAHILPCMLRFFVSLRLALEPDPSF